MGDLMPCQQHLRRCQHRVHCHNGRFSEPDAYARARMRVCMFSYGQGSSFGRWNWYHSNFLFKKLGACSGKHCTGPARRTGKASAKPVLCITGALTCVLARVWVSVLQDFGRMSVLTAHSGFVRPVIRIRFTHYGTMCCVVVMYDALRNLSQSCSTLDASDIACGVRPGGSKTLVQAVVAPCVVGVVG